MLMIRDSHTQSSSRSKGFTLIEVLVTVLIIAIGLLGLAGMQMTSLNNQLEAYQRAQALLLIEDMANRIRANATAARAGGYTLTSGIQYGQEPQDDGCALKATIAERDLCEWNTALKGSTVKLSVSGTDTNVGSVAGARGCIENRTASAGSGDGEVIIRVTIAWLGRAPTISPPPEVTCGEDDFGADDRYRRAVYLDTVLAKLAL
jgi:type IV pilus assembly protein PilV